MDQSGLSMAIHFKQIANDYNSCTADEYRHVGPSTEVIHDDPALLKIHEAIVNSREDMALFKVPVSLCAFQMLSLF